MPLKEQKNRTIEEQILGAIGQHLELGRTHVFLFGSRANGKGDDRSDFDIGIEGEKRIPLRILGAIKESLDALPTLYKIDLVDFRRATPDFRAVALAHIKPLNFTHP